MMDRRETLRTIAGVALLSLSPRELLAFGREAHASANALVVLDPQLAATVIAAAERIIPATETPGASAAHIDRFVDTMLASWYGAAERDRLLAGLRALQGRAFAGRSTSEQTAMLEALDAEATAPDHWFAMFKYLTIWGYYTSEVAQTRELGLWPLAGRYDACAPYTR